MFDAVSAFRSSLAGEVKDTKKTQSTQCEAAYGHEDFFLDCDNAAHLQRLDDWCKFQWRATIERNLKQSNNLRYSQCCNAFTRRGFVKTAGHPEHCSFSVGSLFRMHEISSPEELRDWMVQTARQLSKSGQQMLFPSIKRCHTVTPIEDLAEQYRQQKERLQRQCDQLRQELQDAKTQLDKTKSGTRDMLSAVKHWHSLYEDLLEKYEDADAGYSEPQKRHKLSSDFELCL